MQIQFLDILLAIALGIPASKLITVIIFDIILAKFLPNHFGSRHLLDGEVAP